MKVKVKYIHRLSFSTNLGLDPDSIGGVGAVFLSEIGLQLEGEAAKFHTGLFFHIFGFIPLLLAAYKKAVFAKKSITVPYSVILKSQRSRFSGDVYRITYKLPDGEKRVVKFRIIDSSKIRKKYFSSMLEKYLTTSRMPVES